MVSKQETFKNNPREEANVFSKLLFWWLKGIFYKGAIRDLQIQDLYEPAHSDRSEVLGDRLEREWYLEVAKQKASQALGNNEYSSQKPSLLRCIVRVFFWSFSFQGFLIFLQYIIFRNLQTIFFGWLITYFDRETRVTKEQAYFYAAGVVVTAIASALAGCHANFGVERIGMKIRLACSSLAYRKILRLSKTSIGRTAGGQILNLLSNDVQRFDIAPIYLHYIWIMPIQIILVFYLIWQDVGIATLAGMAAITLQTIPVQGYISKLCARLREQIAKQTDERVQLMSELISGIQVIKMYAWEKAFERIADVIRRREIKLVTLAAYCRGLYLSIMVFGERVTLFVTLVTLVLIGENVNAKMVFTMIAYWQMLQSIMAVFFPLAVTFAGEALISIQRLEDFMQLEEQIARPTNLSTIEISSTYKTCSISIRKLSANWIYGALPPTLNNLNLEVRHGQLCALVGPVGSGKTSILHLILGELPAATGTLDIRGKSVSYAAQEAWLFGGTIRENILYGLPYAQKKYDEVTEVCALKTDFQQLPRGDLTFVGERGASLSGGQRARINLARAVYRDADIYLFDDPLSAVDSCVGRQLFAQCINGYLQGKTRILVTHQLQYLKNADTIVVLKEGCVDSQGTFETLISSNSDFVNLTNSSDTEQDEEESTESARSLLSRPQLQHSVTSGAQLVNSEPEVLAEEEVAKGRMSLKVYKRYFEAGGGIFLRISVLVIVILSQVATSSVDYWVTFWTNQESVKQNLNYTDFPTHSSRFELVSNTSTVWNNVELNDLYTTNTSIAIYGGLIMACVILPAVRGTIFLRMCVNSSQVLYNQMFANLLNASMRFFNTNPSGRILNRFSKDIGAMDEILPRCMAETISIVSMTIGSLIMIIVSNNWMIIPVLILGGICNLARQYYLATAQDIKRLEGVGRSPVFSHVNYSLDGMTTIRSSGAQKRMIREFDSRQNLHTSAWFLFVATGAAFGFVVDIIIAAFIALICFTFVIFDNGNTTSGNVGLAISQSLWLSDAIQFGIKESVRLVAEMTSTERVLQYTNLPVEGPFVSDTEPPPSWPRYGTIEFQNLSLKYDDQKPAVLKNINIHVYPGEKVGIVGRTGAGKSSIVAALLRITSLEGRVMIDDIDTQSIGLHNLRSKISVIPQEPVLFSATLRYNLDPFDEFSDDYLWTALDELGLKQAFTSLDCKINQGGGNMSLGNRQLVCLARAILRNNKILVLDEASANIDPGTDALIQRTIRKKFADCTVLTIAHRLGTIMDSDRVLVLDAGHVVEFDTPYNLLENSDGHFTRMVKGTGTAMAEHMKNDPKTVPD